jgi:enolase
MEKIKIKEIKAKEILDSRKIPTIEVELKTDQGSFLASVPSGVSKGKYEALELRDGGKRYKGKGVLKAISNIKKIIAPKLIGKEIISQEKIDQLLIDLDGTKNKSRLGANAILAISIACCRAGAKAKGFFLWQYIGQLAKNFSKPNLPIPSVLCIEGGLHGKGDLAFQEFMIQPIALSFQERWKMAKKVYNYLKKIIKRKYKKEKIKLGIEGGFTLPLKNTKEALELLEKTIEKVGLQGKVKIAIDVAASHFYKKGKYIFERKKFTREKLLVFYENLIKKYPSIISIEDPFSQEDWKGFIKITKKLGSKIKIVGDDLLVTNLLRIKKAVKEKACNTLLLKPNQIGTVTEAIKAGIFAKKEGWQIMVSHRAGETNDDFISDLAVGLGAEFIKAGALSRPERIAKYKRLLKIENLLIKR